MPRGINKSFLKWAGGKSTSLKMINSAIGYVGGKLIEPFAGSAVVSLNIDALGYIIADSNPHLINLFRQMINDPAEFVNYAKRFFTPESNTEDSYYKNRELFNTSLDPKEKAALFLYLNRHTFNGLCRFNSGGGFNVPFGRYDAVEFPAKELSEFAKRFSEKAQFHCQDFEKTIELAEKEDIVYCDPPYVPLSDTASFNDYTGDGFTLGQQRRLAQLAEESECKFLISNHSTPLTKELYKKARIIERPVGRFIGANKESRKPVIELLAIYNN